MWQFLGSGVPNRIHENVVRELHSAKLPLPKSNFRLLGLKSCWKTGWFFDSSILRFQSLPISLHCGHCRRERATFAAFLDGGKPPSHTRFEKPRTASNRRGGAFQSFCVCRQKQNPNNTKQRFRKSAHFTTDFSTETCTRMEAQKAKEKCEGLDARLERTGISSTENWKHHSLATCLRYTTEGMTKVATNCSAVCNFRNVDGMFSDVLCLSTNHYQSWASSKTTILDIRLDTLTQAPRLLCEKHADSASSEDLAT